MINNKFAVYDIETTKQKKTDKFNTKFLLGVIYDGENYHVCNTQKQMTEIFNDLSKQGIKKIYAHNGGKFDINFILPELIETNKLIIIKQQSTIIECKVHNKEHKHLYSLLDSYLVLRTKLNNLAKEVLHTEKNDITFNKNKIDNELIEYCKKDCKILYDVLQKFFTEIIGKTVITIAGGSMYIFKKNYNDKNIFNRKKHFETDKIFLENFYFGGRVELFKRQYKGKIYYYDINSLYPTVMNICTYPYGNTIETNEYKPDKYGLYTIQIQETKRINFSMLPYRYRTGIFYVSPTKDDIFNITSNEIIWLNENNIKYKILSGYFWENSDYLFTKFVNDFYSLRQKSIECKIFYKYLLNNLYGKFAMNRERELIVNYNPNTEKFLNVEIKPFDDKGIFCIYNTQIFADILPELSIFVCSNARFYMKNFIEKNLENILYSDTDSILLTKQLPKKYIDNSKLGLFKLENIWNEGIFISAKNYALKNKDTEKIVFKGFSNQNFKYKDFDNYINKGTKISETQLRLKQYVKTGLFQEITLQKKLNLLFDKRDLKNNYSYFIKEIIN